MDESLQSLCNYLVGQNNSALSNKYIIYWIWVDFQSYRMLLDQLFTRNHHLILTTTVRLLNNTTTFG